MPFTSGVVAVDTGCLQRIVAELLASEDACNEFVQPLGEVASATVRLAVGCHKIGKTECRLGVVVHS
jgi:hypothetical protein